MNNRCTSISRKVITTFIGVFFSLVLHASEDGDPVNGENAFRNCAACHQAGENAKNAFGPVLTGIVNRRAVSYPNYDYSAGLKRANEKGLVWTEDKLYEWLSNPGNFVKNYLGDDQANSNMPAMFEDPKLRRCFEFCDC